MTTKRDEVNIPGDHAGIYFIGLLIVGWAKIENLIEATLHAYLASHPVGYDLVETLGGEAKIDLLISYLLIENRNKRFKQHCVDLRKDFLACRDNRNFLAHGLIHQRSDGGLIVERLTKKSKRRVMQWVTLKQLNDLHLDMAQVLDALRFAMDNTHSVRKHIKGGSRLGPLPRRISQPRRLSEILPEVRRKPTRISKSRATTS
ncbi:hypothetical protein HNR26_000303 [Rhizobium rosettiformans]|uniref:Uncharacterized protein n=2 Tax=Rhizobium rosettiformans TaxID=1368430 RepID=A0A4S8QC90_9HYPH|nr:hypothetical protein [Rhizobium rosettiformans]MBB5274265.1 hypothetical protein [Rhizobium rosettiformans]THV38094.1 hypothetical protein FAA86_04660 [Rhizobium rosettiformans W3]